VLCPESDGLAPLRRRRRGRGGRGVRAAAARRRPPKRPLAWLRRGDADHDAACPHAGDAATDVSGTAAAETGDANDAGGDGDAVTDEDEREDEDEDEDEEDARCCVEALAALVREVGRSVERARHVVGAGGFAMRMAVGASEVEMIVALDSNNRSELGAVPHGFFLGKSAIAVDLSRDSRTRSPLEIFCADCRRSSGSASVLLVTPSSR